VPSRKDSRFLFQANILNVFCPSQDVFATPSPWQTFFKNCFFTISQKPLEISKNVQNQICRSLNLKYITSLAHFDISDRFWDTGVRKIVKKNTPNFGELLPRLCRPGETLDSQFRQILNVFWPKSRRLCDPQPLTNFFKNSFFQNISNTVRDIKKCIESNL